MTNGEKLCIDFPNMRYTISEHRVITTIGIAASFDLDWWNTEYKEPTKNDLGVDCISREQALVAIRNLYPGMPRVDFNGSLRKWVDKYKPYIECDDAIKQLPSVTPQEPKTGHWIIDTHKIRAFGKKYETHDYSVHCDKCNYACDYTTDRHGSLASNFCPNCGAKMESEDKE